MEQWQLSSSCWTNAAPGSLALGPPGQLGTMTSFAHECVCFRTLGSNLVQLMAWMNGGKKESGVRD